MDKKIPWHQLKLDSLPFDLDKVRSVEGMRKMLSGDKAYGDALTYPYPSVQNSEVLELYLDRFLKE